MKKIIILLLNICLCIIVGTTSIYAWYTSYFGIKTDDTKMLSSNSSYYDSGTGTEADPYIISEARHLYNLAWLQDLGFYDADDDSNLDTPEIDKFYFKLKNDIDMKDLTKNSVQSPIPPIGIDGHPFISNFNGGGFTIDNLIISTDFSNANYIKPDDTILNQHTTDTISGGTIITTGVGTFGVLGSKLETSTETPAAKAEHVQQFYLDNTKIQSSVQASVGIVAGVVHSNLENIGVHYSHIQFMNGATAKENKNLSDYALIGEYDSENANWIDRAGKLENFTFDPDAINQTISGGIDFNVAYPNHEAYNKNIFNLIGELKTPDVDFTFPADIFTQNGTEYSKTYSYENQTYTFKSAMTRRSIQFQDGIQADGVLREQADRHLRFHADGPGKIFLAVAGNGSAKTLEIYKSSQISDNFTSANGTAHQVDYKTFTRQNDKSITTTAKQHELTWGEIEIDEAGDYIFAVDGGNTYLAYLHFIISNNQGNSGGDNAAYTISKIDFVYLDSTTGALQVFDENYLSSYVSFEIISFAAGKTEADLYFRRNNDAGTTNNDVVLFYPAKDSANVTFNYFDTGNKGVATDETCEILSGEMIAGGSGGGGSSGPVVSDTYKISFDVNGGSGTAPTISNKKANESFAIPTTNLTKEGFTFGGWKSSADNKVYQAGDNYTMPTEAVTFTAQWTAVASSTTVIYDFASGIPADSGITYSGKTATNKGTVTYNGTDYSTCLKMESSTNITIKTDYDCTITLVFDAAGSTFKLDGNKITVDSNGQYTLTIKAGTTYTITKGDTNNLFLIIVEK